MSDERHCITHAMMMGKTRAHNSENDGDDDAQFSTQKARCHTFVSLVECLPACNVNLHARAGV